MKQFRQSITATILLSLLLLATACPKKDNGEPIKPSEALTAARSFAIFPVVLAGVANALDILKDDQDLSAPSYKKAIQFIDKSQSKLDDIAAQISSGKWDVEAVREKIRLLIESIKDAVNDGTLRVKNPTKQALFSSILDYAQVILNNIYLVADRLQPVPDSPPAQEGITIGGIAALTSVVAATYAEVRQLTAITDIKTLYELAKSKSTVLHEANQRRLE